MLLDRLGSVLMFHAIGPWTRDLAQRIGQLTPGGGRASDQKKAGLALLGAMAGVLSLSRTLLDQKQSADLLSAARKGALS